MYRWDFSWLWLYPGIVVSAIGVTLWLTALTIVVGVPLGILLTLVNTSSVRWLRYIVAGFIQLVRAVPPLVFVVWIYYCLPILAGITLSAVTTVVIALAVYSAVFFAEIFRAGIQSVERGYMEAAAAVGMRRYTALLRITAPLAFQRVLPPFISQCVLVLKNTSLASIVAVPELLFEGQRLSLQTFRPMETLTVVALIFVAMVIPLTSLASLLERRWRRRYAD